MQPESPLDPVDTDRDDYSCAHSSCSAALTSHTALTSPSLSLHRSQSSVDMAFLNLERTDCLFSNWSAKAPILRTQPICSSAGKQDDVVGQYLAQRAALATNMGRPQAPRPNYDNTCAGYNTQGYSPRAQYDSYTGLQPSQRWYPDPESIRHLHTLHSLLSNIQPERKLNALSGLEIDIIEGHTGGLICRAVPKKMLVLFLGREIVTKFIHTVQRELDGTWRGPPTQQIMILPNRVASPVALRILVSWMIRACTFATMYRMKQIRLPANLFAACSLAQTMEVLGLRRDAYRIDLAISQQSLYRPIYAAEVETLFRCLGESNKYVYKCIKDISSQPRTPWMNKEIKELAGRCPDLYARIWNPELNEEYRPHFGREWFERLRDGRGVRHQVESLSSNTRSLKTHGADIFPLQAITRSSSRLDPSAPDFEPRGTRIV